MNTKIKIAIIEPNQVIPLILINGLTASNKFIVTIASW